jgi:hypothetical protein
MSNFLTVAFNGQLIKTNLSLEEGLAVAAAVHREMTSHSGTGDPEGAIDALVEILRVENSDLWEFADVADDDSDDPADDDPSEELEADDSILSNIESEDNED